MFKELKFSLYRICQRKTKILMEKLVYWLQFQAETSSPAMPNVIHSKSDPDLAHLYLVPDLDPTNKSNLFSQKKPITTFKVLS